MMDEDYEYEDVAPNDIIVVTDNGIEITAEDLAAFIGMIGSIKATFIDQLIESSHPADQRPYQVAYDKARLVHMSLHEE